jgi:hypothetical protein
MIRSAIARRISTAILALGLAIFGALNLRRCPSTSCRGQVSADPALHRLPGATPDDIDRNPPIPSNVRSPRWTGSTT